jgi:CelD/BcsL family acetyltransferase involved in cellulose biosynthesis
VTARTHDDWTSAGFTQPPVADAVGPFAGSALLEAWWHLRGKGTLAIVESSDALFATEECDTTIRLVGEADLFDYHSPLGAGAADLIAAWARDLPSGINLELDSLPGEAADSFMNGLRAAGLAPVAEVHESAAVVDLPDDFDAYLALLGKKQRHETRRKSRRFGEILGPPRLEREAGKVAVARFAEMHRLADGRKGAFMSAEMETLFAAFHQAGGVIDFLYGDGADPVAAAFGFEDDGAYYLYNSAYDPDAGAASPGIVLVSELIKQATAKGKTRFDFLKGDEVYKYRLGAAARPLWRITATVGGAS